MKRRRWLRFLVWICGALAAIFLFTKFYVFSSLATIHILHQEARDSSRRLAEFHSLESAYVPLVAEELRLASRMDADMAGALPLLDSASAQRPWEDALFTRVRDAARSFGIADCERLPPSREEVSLDPGGLPAVAFTVRFVAPREKGLSLLNRLPWEIPSLAVSGLSLEGDPRRPRFTCELSIRFRRGPYRGETGNALIDFQSEILLQPLTETVQAPPAFQPLAGPCGKAPF